MDVDAYGKAKAGIVSRLLAAIAWVLRAFLTKDITEDRWQRMINTIYPAVQAARDESALLARQFFDDNRSAQLPGSGRQGIFLNSNYRPEWLDEALRPVFDDLKKTGNTEGANVVIANRITKVVEDAGRNTLKDGVKRDRKALGWARYDPRPPTCAFCTMMISRGPVYKARTGGFTGREELAKELWEDGDTDALNELMNRWHPGCTCIVVPVYNTDDYPTKEQEDAAWDIYVRARRIAKSGRARDILRAMRQLLYQPEEGQDETTLP